MNIEHEIRSRLEAKFKCQDLEVINETQKHHGHVGDNGSGQTHFRVVMVSSDFTNMSRVQRHQAVNDLLSDLFDHDLHALALSLKSQK